jgi:trk system potassium uptake protein TrkH
MRSPTISRLQRGLRALVPSGVARRAIFAPPAAGPGLGANARLHAQFFVLGLIVTALVGTALLSSPWITSSGERAPVVDALFTAISAVSTTGLATVDTRAFWNWQGEVVILVLIQIGGLGFSVGASLLLQMLRRGAGAYTLRDELLLKNGSPALSLQEAASLSGRIIRFTLVAEGIGAIALAAWFALAVRMPPLEALWNGLFFAVAAFCNAGFDLTGGFQAERPAVAAIWVNLVLMALIQAGALSYIVFADLGRKRSWRSLSLDTKIVLAMNAALLASGAAVFLAAEWGGALATLTPGSKILAALFQSVSARTAGFNTINWNLAHPLTLFFWLGLMLIGGAAGSTAGGVGLNTVGVVLASVSSTLRGNAETQIWGRRIATPLIFRAVTVIVLFLALYGVAAAALSIAEHHIGERETGMIDLMFESMSALSTTGVSTGITPALTVAGKLVLCATMFLGRLGPLTAVYALQRRQRPEKYRFPEEAVRIG